jgi:hypothetical protein
MPSDFLKQRHASFLAEQAGGSTISYFCYVPGTENQLTGDVDEDAAYPDDPIPLPALIDLAPSRAMREKIGLEINFDATVRITAIHATESAIAPRIGDKCQVPGEAEPYYVMQVIRDKQCQNSFLEFVLAVSKKVGRRGD